eukprot:SAG31_NODE_15368_length_758_cov_1.517451_1_plen_76_part_00
MYLVRVRYRYSYTVLNFSMAVDLTMDLSTGRNLHIIFKDTTFSYSATGSLVRAGRADRYEHILVLVRVGVFTRPA